MKLLLLYDFWKIIIQSLGEKVSVVVVKVLCRHIKWAEYFLFVVSACGWSKPIILLLIWTGNLISLNHVPFKNLWFYFIKIIPISFIIFLSASWLFLWSSLALFWVYSLTSYTGLIITKDVYITTGQLLMVVTIYTGHFWVFVFFLCSNYCYHFYSSNVVENHIVYWCFVKLVMLNSIWENDIHHETPLLSIKTFQFCSYNMRFLQESNMKSGYGYYCTINVVSITLCRENCCMHDDWKIYVMMSVVIITIVYF